MNSNRPIGIFDSGVGGLTIWAEIARLLPQEASIYVADGANCPYGPRSADEIIKLSGGVTRFLVEGGCKLAVVACNTASAAALDALRAEFEIPIVGLEPAIKPAAQASKTGHIGILATEGTFRGSLFLNTSQTHANNVTIHQQIAHGLVDLVEAGQLTGPQTEALLRQHLQPMLNAGVDQLVLGCTHYPFLTPVIEKIVGKQMTVINPAQAVAAQVRRILAQNDLLAKQDATGSHTFYTTGQADALQTLLLKLGKQFEVEKLTWDGERLLWLEWVVHPAEPGSR